MLLRYHSHDGAAIGAPVGEAHNTQLAKRLAHRRARNIVAFGESYLIEPVPGPQAPITI